MYYKAAYALDFAQRTSVNAFVYVLHGHTIDVLHSDITVCVKGGKRRLFCYFFLYATYYTVMQALIILKLLLFEL